MSNQHVNEVYVVEAKAGDNTSGLAVLIEALFLRSQLLQTWLGNISVGLWVLCLRNWSKSSPVTNLSVSDVQIG